MASYSKKEARSWAKQHLRGVANVVIPSYTGDLKRLNEKGIRHDVRHEIALGFAGTLLVSEVAITLDEYALLMSPNPRETRDPSDTTQDGVLTHHVIPANSVVVYAYGDFVADGVLPGPAWWCSEAFEYVKTGITITLGGEIMPFDLNQLLGTMRREQKVIHPGFEVERG